MHRASCTVYTTRKIVMEKNHSTDANLSHKRQIGLHGEFPFLKDIDDGSVPMTVTIAHFSLLLFPASAAHILCSNTHILPSQMLPNIRFSLLFFPFGIRVSHQHRIRSHDRLVSETREINHSVGFLISSTLKDTYILNDYTIN